MRLIPSAIRRVYVFFSKVWNFSPPIFSFTNNFSMGLILTKVGVPSRLTH